MRFVAFLDVLGFKDMVENCTHEKLERVYHNAFVTNTTYSLANGKVLPVKTEKGDFVIPDLSNPLTSCLIVSDSVILWTDDLSMKSFVNIFSTVGKILVSGFYTGLPMRGGIALGEFSTLSNAPSANGNVTIQSVFGKALTNAYKIESIQQWAGCAISQACIDQYMAESLKHLNTTEELATLDYLEAQRILIRYPVPIKGGTSEIMWVVNWPKFNYDFPSEEIVQKAFGMHNKNLTDPYVQTKLKNTLDYLRHASLTA